MLAFLAGILAQMMNKLVKVDEKQNVSVNERTA